ncbi:MAG: hypothetical protein EXR79_13855 [Myxococcales bacterium]|nr:hypothetical protein [Myxococcales bacterium]
MNERTFSRIAVLNRGEAACRFLRGLREYDLHRGTRTESAAFVSDPDMDAPWLRQADIVVALGPPLVAGADGRTRSAYLDTARVIELALAQRCDAVWAGWGFASEDPDFVEAVAQAGMAFLGPSAAAMRALGDKRRAKDLAILAGVPLAPWAHVDDSDDAAALGGKAEEIGFPLMVKASAGGGGRGIRKVTHAAELVDAVASVRAEVARVFGQGSVLLEACVEHARHVEVQIVAGVDGRAVGVGVRDCSIQRRHQKVVEEAPSPVLPQATADDLCHAAARLAESAGYVGVGTAEFLWSPATGQATFLEVNARLQVEHTITELTTGIDLVHAQIDIARGLPWRRPAHAPGGHAIEVRLCAEDPERGCAPAPGRVRLLRMPAGPGIRVDAAVEEGMDIAPQFDSMVAKIMAWAPDRPLALARLRRAIDDLQLVIEDGAHNKPLLAALLCHPAVVDGSADTGWMDRALPAGELRSPERPLEALLAAAVHLHDGRTAGAVEAFFAAAQAGFPRDLPAPDGSALELQLGGQRHAAIVYRTGPRACTVDLGGQLYAVRCDVDGPHALTLHVADRRHAVLIGPAPNGLRLEVDGSVHVVTLAAGGVVRAPAPALVVRIHVEPGTVVAVGTPLLTLEAMKLELPLLAEVAGRVKAVVCRVHEQIAAGQVLLELEADADGQDDVVPTVALPAAAPAPLDALVDQGAIRPERLDRLDEARAAAALDGLKALACGLLLGYDITPHGERLLDGLMRKELDFSLLAHPERWRPLADLLADFASIEALFLREVGSDGFTAEFAFHDLCRRLGLRDAAVEAAKVPRLAAALACFGLTAAADPAAVREALWRMARAHQHAGPRHRAVSTLLRAVLGMHEVGLPLPPGLRDTLDLVARAAAPSHPTVADNARQALLVLDLLPRWQAWRAEVEAHPTGASRRVTGDAGQGALDRADDAGAPLAPPLPPDADLPILPGVDVGLAIRLELWRYSAFQLERLPAPEPLLALRAVARSHTDDERYIVLAEVRDLPERAPASSDVHLVPFELAFLEATRLLREVQSRRDPRKRLHMNRMVFHVRPELKLKANDIARIAARMAPHSRGLGLEKVVISARVPATAGQPARRCVFVISTPGRHRLDVRELLPSFDRVRPLDDADLRRIQARRLGATCPYELVRMLEGKAAAGLSPHPDLNRGRFIEHDLDPSGARLVPVSRPAVQNAAGVVVGLIRHATRKHPDGIERVLIASDPTMAMGALGEAECRRVLAAFDLADQRGLPVEWVPVSSGARIAMDSGTENLDWTARVLRRIVTFTRSGGVVHVLVAGTCVGAQSYWNAMATMLLHTRGILVMTPDAAMVLTGKRALEVSGSVAAEDERGIGGFDRVMGPNGQAQFLARDLGEAYAILFEHYRFTWCRRGEPGPRRFETTDPAARSVLDAPYRAAAGGFEKVGDIFDEARNPGRKQPFAIREVMAAVIDQDGGRLERWAWWRDAETAVVWDAHLGGIPCTVMGFESQPLARRGAVPIDGPDTWSGGTLFPQSSKKVARGLRAASGNRPVVVLANLSGFDGSPESMRRLQLEHGAEIGRAVVEFDGPLLFAVVGRYHGGAYVVFSKALNPRLEALAVEGSFASVIGGAPAAAVVFPREVRRRADGDPRVVAARAAVEAAPAAKRPRLRERLDHVLADVVLATQAEVAAEFDAVHSVERAVRVGSLDAVIPPARLRPELIERLQRALEVDWARAARQVSAAGVPG